MRITTFPLTLQDESPRNRQESPTPEDNSSAPVFLPLEGPAAYISLLGNEPYKLPDVLMHPSVSSSPRLSLPTSATQDFVLTPDTLRFMGSTVGKLSSQIHEVQLAYKSVETRTMLQQQELKRQIEKCQQIGQSVDSMKEGCVERLLKRINTIEERQKAMLGRLDRTLQALMEKACPELSEHEMKWFDELKRMKKEVSSSSGYDERALAARTKYVGSECCGCILCSCVFSWKESLHV
jgi:nucleoporin NUP82